VLNKFIFLLFLLGLFFFPFNSFEGLKVLGEFKNESGAYFFLLGFILFCFSNKIYIPTRNSVFVLMLIFIVWCFITTVLNFKGVSVSYFKSTTGINRFIRQYFSLIMSSIIFFLFYYNQLLRMELKDILIIIRKVFLCSLIFAMFLGTFETMYGVFGISVAKVPIEILNYFPFLEKDYFSDRISSISDEPPLLAIYLITIAGWMFSYIITHKSIFRYIPMICVLILTFFSGSRTALIIVVLQLVLFFVSIMPREQVIKAFVSTAVVVMLFFSSLIILNGDKIIKSFNEKIESLNFKDNLTKSISNQSRFGIQYASTMVFLEHPVIGVGFGQQTYYSRFHYPAWATKKNYEFKEMYKNKKLKAFPPGYNIYTRLLAEIGIVGVLLLLILEYFSVKRAKILSEKSTGDKQVLAIILFISLIGLFVNWMTIDTFRLYGVWFSLALLIRLSKEKIVIINE